MLQVLFSNVTDNLIPNHTRIDFGEVVKMTHELELKCREENKIISSEFAVISSETNTTLYKGVFNFGSYDYPNIYQQIKELAQRIKVNKQNQADKAFLLEQIEELTDEEFKKEEKIDKMLINLDKSKVSRLKRWQRITIYSIAAVTSFSLAIVLVSSVTQKIQYEQALMEGRELVEKRDTLIKNYELGLLGKDEEMVEYLNDGNLTDNQERILANVYLSKNEFEKAVELLDDPVYVETILITSDSWTDQEKVEKIKAFNELYPTNEARFDLAYYEKQYELMLNLPPINMTIERSKMKTYALMKLGKIEEAKVELNNNSDEELRKKIDRYEVLQAEIKTLTDQLNKENQVTDKDENLIKKITDELNKKKKEFESL